MKIARFTTNLKSHHSPQKHRARGKRRQRHEGSNDKHAQDDRLIGVKADKCIPVVGISTEKKDAADDPKQISQSSGNV
jgi:hypothetical protein